MKRESIRIGNKFFVNTSTLNRFDGLDLIFGGFQKFVYISDYDPWELVNDTWTGALSYIMNDMHIDWKLCIIISTLFHPQISFIFWSKNTVVSACAVLSTCLMTPSKIWVVSKCLGGVLRKKWSTVFFSNPLFSQVFLHEGSLFLVVKNH
jgi:DNA-binding XRE family transcriptional regulator